jgi:hypothetical protein
MKRREFVTSVLAAGVAVPAAAATKQEEHKHTLLEGLLANATVSFGGWPGPLPDGKEFDRNNPPLPPPAPPPNLHAMVPHIATIREGGTVNFIIAGLHQVIVYGDGKKPEDVVTTPVIVPGIPPPVINDPDRRIFRGILPVTGVPFDRVEVVQFTRRGLYLVICGIRPHFVNDDMYGWVRVIR